MMFARHFFSRPTALIGFAVFVAIALLALLAPVLFARGPFSIVGMPLLPPGPPWPAISAAPVSPPRLAAQDNVPRPTCVACAPPARQCAIPGRARCAPRSTCLWHCSGCP